MSIELHGITHVALECSSPTRMERYLRDAFGMQLLRVGYWQGEYVRVVGSPFDQRENPGFVHLYNRPFIPRGRLRYVAVGVRERDVDSVVGELRARGYYDIDGEDIITAPEGLRIKLDSFTHPRPLPTNDPVTKMVEAETDPNLACLVRGVHHVAVDAGEPRNLFDWFAEPFGDRIEAHGDRRGDFFSGMHSKGPPDPIGRTPGPLVLVLRRDILGSQLNHIAFDMPDAEAAIDEIEFRGSKVDLAGDAMIQGPEEVWYQIDSRATPYPKGHLGNDPEVGLDAGPNAFKARAWGVPHPGFARARKGDGQ